jgi:uncharacterized Zn finger protein
MSPDERDRDPRNVFVRSGPKRPPPEHGIKVQAAGLTWWGQRWMEALERMAPEYRLRLDRGKTYARAGRTHDLVVETGRVTAKVTGSRAKPYDIELRLTPLTAAGWDAAIAIMADKAQFSAALLAGEMPRAIDEAFEGAGVSLFPTRVGELVTECNCPDWANPCKHVAATHHVLGEALDRDPFLLFELRGRSKEAVLAALRAARSGGDADVLTESPHAELGTSIAAIRLDPEAAADYDAPRAPLPSLQLDFDPPSAHAAVLTQLGKPSAWRGEGSPLDLLAPIVKAAAARARAIALSEIEEPETGPDTVEPEKAPPAKPRRKSASKSTRKRR